MGNRIYLDHAATTPMLPEAIAAVEGGMRRWANPSSPHAEGRAARAALEDARARIKAALDWDGEVILTSGASESIAIALGRTQGGVRIVSAVEHDSVLRAVPGAERFPVSSDGRIDRDAFGPALRRAGERPVVAVQHVNSETGVVQPIGEIAKAVHAAGGLLFSDCAQSAGRLPTPDADLIAVSAHKLGGPPGVGALLVRDPAMLIPSGGQERGYRAGTENLAGVLGFAAALEAIGPRTEGVADWVSAHIANRNRLDAALEAVGGVAICGPSLRSPLVATYRMPGMQSAAQLVRFDLSGFAVSAGSACSSGTLKASPVMEALRLDPIEAGQVVRVSFGQTTTAAEIDAFAAAWTTMACEATHRAA
ncbi:cysteine desulfurase family protein [Sphingomonas sp. AX6]|uniref:cysteine desulfurase family protein n=1 Tax=Sphingomonas sp. AX6 TaxID=2653171 RepID=UPI0012F06C56|nr:aminotransferase class V-fold PLP-dependent enzyme [Sphingomonas sp. AX6]VXC99585.1 Cysteine desulfurase [Sphingomonas sp. AX6]